MCGKRMRGWLAGALTLPLLVAVTACGVAPGANATPAATTTTFPATATPVPAANCQSLAQMRGARQGIEILDTDFPDMASAIVTITSPTSAPMQVVRYVACMQVYVKGTVGDVSVPVVSNTSSPSAEVVEALNLVNRGWTKSVVFPFDGTHLQPCTAAQLCYGGLQNYIELEQITDHGHGVLTFVMRVAAPQPLVACDPALFPGGFYPASDAVLANATFPLPPATQISSGYGDATGITTYFCTGSTAASIQAFMAQHLPAAGWSSLTVNGVQIWKFPSGIGPVYMRINPIIDPHKWSILTYNPGSNLG